MARGTPLILTTGYSSNLLASRYPRVPRCEKPVDQGALPRTLSAILARRCPAEQPDAPGGSEEAKEGAGIPHQR